LISLWDVDWEIFVIGDQELELEVEDIYYITGLSRIGERIQLFGPRIGGESTNALIKRNCLGVETTASGKVKILIVDNLPLRTILHTMAHIVGSQALHKVLKSQFQYAVDYLTPTMFNWCEGLLANMKRQLTKGKQRKLKQFGFGSILVALFLEHVPLFWY